MISMTTAPNATVRIKKGDLVPKKSPHLLGKNEKKNLSLRSLRSRITRGSGERLTSEQSIPMSYQRTAGLSDQQLFDEFDREFAAIEEEDGGGCTVASDS